MVRRDRIVRAMTNDGAFRVMAAETTDLVQQALRVQSAAGLTAHHFGDMLTGSVLFRETMAPNLRVQLVVRGSTRGTIVADSYPGGLTRGLIQLPDEDRQVDLGPGALFQGVRTLPNGELQQGVIEFPENRDISSAMMAYMQQSEQVFSMVALATVVDAAGAVIAAGGYLLQLLPEANHEGLALMTDRIERDFTHIGDRLRDTRADPDALLDALLEGHAYTRLSESDLSFGCTCNEVRVVSALASMGRSDIEALVKEARMMDVSCEYCGSNYRISPETLRAMLESS